MPDRRTGPHRRSDRAAGGRGVERAGLRRRAEGSGDCGAGGGGLLDSDSSARAMRPTSSLSWRSDGVCSSCSAAGRSRRVTASKAVARSPAAGSQSSVASGASAQPRSIRSGASSATPSPPSRPRRSASAALVPWAASTIGGRVTRASRIVAASAIDPLAAIVSPEAKAASRTDAAPASSSANSRIAGAATP